MEVLMNAIRLDKAELFQSRGDLGGAERFVDAKEFQALIVSHRRMVREDKGDALVRGLRDLDTGEIFLVDERRLFDVKR